MIIDKYMNLLYLIIGLFFFYETYYDRYQDLSVDLFAQHLPDSLVQASYPAVC